MKHQSGLVGHKGWEEQSKAWERQKTFAGSQAWASGNTPYTALRGGCGGQSEALRDRSWKRRRSKWISVQGESSGNRAEEFVPGEEALRSTYEVWSKRRVRSKGRFNRIFWAHTRRNRESPPPSPKGEGTRVCSVKHSVCRNQEERAHVRDVWKQAITAIDEGGETCWRPFQTVEPSNLEFPGAAPQAESWFGRQATTLMIKTKGSDFLNVEIKMMVGQLDRNARMSMIV